MADRRIVQCFGTLRKPGKPARPCREKFLWIAAGTRGNFGSKGTKGACPHCGTLVNLAHPVNVMLDGGYRDEAEYQKALQNYYFNPDGTPKKTVENP